jgi:hypothetical protein
VLRFWFQSKTRVIEAKIILLGSAKRGIFACFASTLNSKKAKRMRNDAKRSQARGKKQKLLTKMMEINIFGSVIKQLFSFAVEKSFFCFEMKNVK